MKKRVLLGIFGMVLLFGGSFFIDNLEAKADISDCEGTKDAVVYDEDPTLCEYYHNKCCIRG